MNDPEGNIVLTNLIFMDKNDGWHLVINTWHGGETSSNGKSKDTIKLTNGIKASYSESENQKTITWNTDSKTTYEVTLLTLNGEYQKDMLIESVNSME